MYNLNKVFDMSKIELLEFDKLDMKKVVADFKEWRAWRDSHSPKGPRTWLETAYLGLGNWAQENDERDSEDCGLCSWSEFYRHLTSSTLAPCECCLFNCGVQSCSNYDCPWAKWNDDKTEENAQVVFEALVVIYKRAWKKANELS